MRSRRACCVLHDERLRPVVVAALATAGLTVEHAAALPAEPHDLALIVVDRATRQATGEALRALPVPVVVVGDDLDDDGLIALMLDAPVSHLVEDPADRGLGITSEKLATGDLFGIEKYIPGARVGERNVRDDADKRHAMDEVCAWAESVGARRPVIHRITSVVDELLMNALRTGPAMLRWAADERTLAISVVDSQGALCQRDVIDHVRRARRERGKPNPISDGGAGLGLYLVLANVASLVVNVAPGRKTEVVCLFDLARGSRPTIGRARSLHVFSAAG